MSGGGKKQTVVNYVSDNDYLIAFGPIWNIWAMWRNGNLYGYTPSVAGEFIEASDSKIGKHSFSVSSGTWTSDELGWHASGTVTPDGGFHLDGIIAIANSYSMSATFNDYGGAGTVTQTSTVTQYLYNTAATTGDPGSMAWRPNSQWLGKPLANNGHCTFGIGSKRGQAAWTVTMPLSWTPVDSTIIVWWGETQSGKNSPLVALGYQYEAQLGELAAGGGANPPWTYPDFSGVYAPTQDLGSSGTTPNDNIEAQGLFSLTEELQANPADIMLDMILSGNIFFSS
jgi:hypothetical protein